MRIAINGFGRIGRLVLRQALTRKGITVVAVNDLVPPDNLAYLFRYDTAHGTFPGNVEVMDGHLLIDGHKIAVLSEKEPEKLPWGQLDVDIVIESSGRFTAKEEAEKHLKAGAKRVILTAPGKGKVPTFVMGVNDHLLDPKERVISNASCTTNCLAVLAKVMNDHFGIEEALMSTIHATTASQPSVDAPSKKDFRGGRASGHNIIPASTGAAKAVTLCLPELEGKLTGMAFRVPILDVSVVDLTVRVSKSTTYEKICQVMKEESVGKLRRFLHYTEDEVVSSDFLGSKFSAIFDAKAGIGLNDKFFKLVAWYDNEMGYAARVVDLVEAVATKE